MPELERFATSLEIKVVDTTQRLIAGHAAIFSNLDRNGDVIAPGAFKRTLTENPDVIALIGHDLGSLPVGEPRVIREDAKGLYTETYVFPTSAGNDLLAVAAALHARGKSLGMSIGYRTKNSDRVVVDGTYVRKLLELELAEYSFLAAPALAANPMALTLGVKSAVEEIPVATTATFEDYRTTVASINFTPQARWSAAGFDVKATAIGDVLHDGKTGVPLWRRSMLDAPNDRLAESIVGSLDRIYASAFEHWLQLSARHHFDATPLLPEVERKALIGGTDSAGGYLVPGELAASIIAVITERSAIRRAAQTIPCGADGLSVPVASWTADWSPEVTPAGSIGVASFAKLSIPVKKLMVREVCSNDLISDVPSFSTWLSTAAGAAISNAENTAFMTGVGPLEPVGLMNIAGIATVDIEGSTANTVSNTTAAAGSAPKLIGLSRAQLSDAFSARAQWFFRPAIWDKIGKLVDASGNPYFRSALNSQDEPTLDGRPVSLSDSMATDGTDANKVALLVDLSQVILAERAAISVQLASEAYIELDQTVVVVRERIGLGLATTSAAVIGVV